MNVGNSTTKCAALGVFWNSGRSGVATNSTQRQLELLRIIEQAGWEYTASFDCAAWRLLYYNLLKKAWHIFEQFFKTHRKLFDNFSNTVSQLVDDGFEHFLKAG